MQFFFFLLLNWAMGVVVRSWARSQGVLRIWYYNEIHAKEQKYIIKFWPLNIMYCEKICGSIIFSCFSNIANQSPPPPKTNPKTTTTNKTKNKQIRI